jgi:hypothetical protein
MYNYIKLLFIIKLYEYTVFDDGSEWTLFRGFNTCESNGLSIQEWIIELICMCK